MEDPYEMMVRKNIDDAVSGLSQDISKITVIDNGQSQLVLDSLLSSACVATHASPIMLARNYFKQINPEWLELAMPLSINNVVNLDEEWDYRRLLELLEESCPKLISKYVEIGEQSNNTGVREAAKDHKKDII